MAKEEISHRFKSALLTVALSVFCVCSSPCAVQADDSASAVWAADDSAARIAFAKGDLVTAKAKWQSALKAADDGRQIEPGVVNCLTGLALVADKSGRKDESERLYELAMRNMESLTGPSSPRFADWMPDLALLYESHGKVEKAEVLYKRALSIDEDAFGKKDLRVAEVLAKYQRFLKRQNRIAEAEQVQQQVQSIKDSQSPE